MHLFLNSLLRQVAVLLEEDNFLPFIFTVPPVLSEVITILSFVFSSEIFPSLIGSVQFSVSNESRLGCIINSS